MDKVKKLKIKAVCYKESV